MNNLSTTAKVYILGIILLGLVLIGWSFQEVAWTELGLYILAVLAAVAQTYKVEGPNDKTNYNIAWFVYGFTFIALGVPATVFVIVVAHLVEWAWHKYPWYIQSFNIGAYALVTFLAGLAYRLISGGSQGFDLNRSLAIAAALLAFVLGNHFLVGLVVWLARGQRFAESGVFGFFSLFLDFTLLAMGSVTAIIWAYSPFAAGFNILPLYLLYNAIRVPALTSRIEDLERQVAGAGD